MFHSIRTSRYRHKEIFSKSLFFIQIFAFIYLQKKTRFLYYYIIHSFHIRAQISVFDNEQQQKHYNIAMEFNACKFQGGSQPDLSILAHIIFKTTQKFFFKCSLLTLVFFTHKSTENILMIVVYVYLRWYTHQCKYNGSLYLYI